MKTIPIIHTNRLLLNGFVQSDSKRVKKLVGIKAIARNVIHIPYPYSETNAQKWISVHLSNYLEGRNITWAVRKKPNLLIGSISLMPEYSHKRAEVGYWFGKKYWNQGYCTEALKAVISYGFNELKLNKICSSHFSKNPASGRVMQKCGMLLEGCRRDHIIKKGTKIDLIEYGILKRDIRSNKSLELTPPRRQRTRKFSQNHQERH